MYTVTHDLLFVNRLLLLFVILAKIKKYRPEAVYIASLGGLTITVGLNRLHFHEKRHEILPAQT